MAQGLERSRSHTPPAAPVRPARTARRAGGKRAVEERRHCHDASPPLVSKIHVNSWVSEALRPAVDQWTGELQTYDRACTLRRAASDLLRPNRRNTPGWDAMARASGHNRSSSGTLCVPQLTQLRVSCAAQVAQEILSCVDRRDRRVDVAELTGVSRVASNVRAKAFGTIATDAERAACSSHCQPAVEG
jgi:hypothetical protein